jgi:hypothetical protein
LILFISDKYTALLNSVGVQEDAGSSNIDQKPDVIHDSGFSVAAVFAVVEINQGWCSTTGIGGRQLQLNESVVGKLTLAKHVLLKSRPNG